MKIVILALLVPCVSFAQVYPGMAMDSDTGETMQQQFDRTNRAIQESHMRNEQAEMQDQLQRQQEQINHMRNEEHR